MSRDAVSGALLIAGGLVTVVVMGLHPTAHGLMNEETFARTAHLSMLVHALAIAATPVIFLGLLGAARRVGPSDLAVAALVSFGFGSFAVLGAALASGFIFPGVVARIVAAEGSNVPHAFLVYTSLWNQAFATVHVVAHAAGTVLLSAAILRHRERLPLAAVTGIAGVVVSVAVLFLFHSGRVHLDVHGARILWFAQAGWLIWLGIVLCLGRGTPPAPGASQAP
jgi:hypothetical protein